MISDSVTEFKRFLGLTSLDDSAHSMVMVMVMRMMLAFMSHRGRMSCSRAGAAIRTEPVHRAQITRFLARLRWQKDDFNAPLRAALLKLEAIKGKFLFIIDATLCGQSGKKTQNTDSTSNIERAKRVLRNTESCDSSHLAWNPGFRYRRRRKRLRQEAFRLWDAPQTT